MKYAVTDYDGCEYITAGKRYEVISGTDNHFTIIDDEGERLSCRKKKCPHLDFKNWRIEMNNDIEQQGNDFEVKYDPEEIFVKDGEIFNASKHGFKEYATRYIRAALQKQPEMSKSEVTRSDVELRDWYAKTALQSVISNTKLTPKQMTNYANAIADLMMEARK